MRGAKKAPLIGFFNCAYEYNRKHYQGNHRVNR